MFIIMGVGNCLLYATESKSITDNIKKKQHCIELSSESALNKLKIKVNITKIGLGLNCRVYVRIYLFIYLYNIQELSRKLPPNEM